MLMQDSLTQSSLRKTGPVHLRGLLADTRPLAVPAFRRLWTANVVTVVGAQLTVVAVPVQIYAQTG